jgi:hypothetical protein
MASAFELINSYTVSGASTNSVIFASIPNTYKDLAIYVSARTNVAGNYDIDSLVQLNSQNTSGNYVGQFAYFRYGTDGSTSLPYQNTDPSAGFVSASNNNTSDYFSTYWSYIADYNSSNLSQRMYLGSTLSGTGISVFGKARAGTGAAVTSLTFKQLSSQNFVAGSTFYLYGIKNT